MSFSQLPCVLSDLHSRVSLVIVYFCTRIVSYIPQIKAKTLLSLFLSLPPAPPLTLDNILNVVKNVRSWRTLGQYIYSYSSSDLDAIQQLHASDEACLKDVIEGFLSGKGDRYRQLSWRALIWSLYKANEIQLAEHVRSFAEPVQGNEFYY